MFKHSAFSIRRSAILIVVLTASAHAATVSYLKQSTSTTLLLGPFVDDTDGKTAETSLTLSQADVLLWKQGGTTLAQKNESTSCTHRSNGLYTCPIDSTDTNTVGVLTVSIAESGALPIRQDYLVLPANVYDSLIGGSDTLQADVTQWTGTNVGTPDTAGYPKVTLKTGSGAGEIGLTGGVIDNVETLQNPVSGVSIGGIPVGAFVSGAITADAIAADAIGASEIAADAIGASEIAASAIGASELAADAIGGSELAADAVTEIQSGLSTYAGGDTSGTTTLLSRLSATRAGYLDNLSGGAVALAAGVTVTTNNDKTGYGLATGAITASVIATDAIGSDEIASTAVTELQSGLSTLTSAQVNSECDTALADVGLTTTITGRIDAAISTRLASASYTSPLDAAGTRTAVGLASANLDTQLSTLSGYVDTEIAFIKTVTDNLATALELDGSVYRFTTNALEQAPSSGGSCDEASIADAVWDELLADHAISGSAGAGLAAAQSAGDPWSTLLPGSYTTGTAGLQLATIYGRLGSMRVTVQNPVASDGTLTITQGDDYSSTSSLSISRIWSGSNLTGGTMVFSAMTADEYNAGTGTAALDSIACTFTGGTTGSTVVVTIPLTAVQTAGLNPSPTDDPLNYVYQIKCTTTGSKVHTLFLGSMTVKRSVD